MPVCFLHHRVATANNAPSRNIKLRKYQNIYGKNDRMKINIKCYLFLLLFFCYISYEISEEKMREYKYTRLYNKDRIFLAENNYSKYLQKYNNKLIKIINGNRVKLNKIKIMQYNKGNSNFSNHIQHFQNIMDAHDPQIMCVSEANIKSKDVDSFFNHFPGYSIEINLQYKDT